MKLTSFYYLSYPDSSPPDPLVAESEVYFEVSETEGNTDNFDFTYSIRVCTVGFIRQQLENSPFFVSKSMIIVNYFEDSIIRNALESILPRVGEIAQPK
jgi:hypothetical protein